MKKPAKPSLTFERLVADIRRMHDDLTAQAGRAVNIYLTVRNWLIGHAIVNYEQNGTDRATYGERLMEKLAARLKTEGMERADERELRRYRQFYLTYPQIRESLSPDFIAPLNRSSLLQSSPKAASVTIIKSEIRETPSPELAVPAARLLNSLSFSHFDLLIQIDDPVKRTFYEIECIRGGWAVRELKRQIASLYYERSGLSRDKSKLAELTQSGAEQAVPQLAIRDPYVFEFLGLKSREVMRESDLEAALLDKLQEFLLELGNGFCFEARQKRILIGDSHGFVDLVFYHRILKCHVLVELKIEAFTHENLGQLNTYVSWFKKNMMASGDNPPVGILLCTQKDHALVEYALAGIDNKLFVSKYQLELPKKEEMKRFLEEKIREAGETY